MSAALTAPYGAWRSPITSDVIVAATIGLTDVLLDGDEVYWIEARPQEAGRNVVIRRDATGAISEVMPSTFNARTRVHEYGGGAVVADDSIVFASNFDDQRLYRQDGSGGSRPLTVEGFRYADGRIDRRRRRWIGVREEHTDPNPQVVVNTLVAVDTEGSRPEQILVTGSDFYASPRISPDGSRLAWLSWNHPNMPWVGTELWVAEITADGTLKQPTKAAGGPSESIFQPEWSPNGILHFISDRSGWWNLYRTLDGNDEPLCPMAAEFGQPQWNFGMSTYAFVSADQLICAYIEDGLGKLASLDVARRRLLPLDLPYTDYAAVRAHGSHVVFRAGSPTTPASVVQLDLNTQQCQVLRRANELAEQPNMRGYFSAPQPIDFPTEGGLTAHALYYPPTNPHYRGPADDLPPLVVKTHGGPTASASSVLDVGIQFWTSRGIAVLDVNYGGSTGYGRAYRERLHQQWGIVDVDDCINAAKYLIAEKKVDRTRVVITGGSAGGYTTLAALTFRDFFQAGGSHYGVSDTEALVRDTHKFESRYLDWLIGPYPAQQALYRERSPIYHVERLSVPVIFFQGEEDKIVPPNQTTLMVEALQRKKIPAGYWLFAGEQHGFRQAENIKRALDAELYFYAILVFRTGLYF
jgi:dipeptidyl aminopeptidase/acylaminoacyl peptidase